MRRDTDQIPGLLPAVSAMLVLSGLSALVLQVVWVRLLALSVGSTSASVSTVLAAFFLGLALGSLLAERIIRGRHELIAYAALETGIALSSRVLLPVLMNLTAFAASVSWLGDNLIVKFAAAMALLAVPTLCMGATVPVMTAFVVRRNEQTASFIGSTYSANTAGAVLGAALCGFVLIPNVGLDGALGIAVSANLLAAVGALAAARRFGAGTAVAATAPGEVFGEVPGEAPGQDPYCAATSRQSGIREALLVLSVTGAVSIAVEVGWTKYLAIFAGTTIYGFSAILSIFLCGIAAGSWWMHRRVETLGNPRGALCAGALMLAVGLLVSRTGLSSVPSVAEALGSSELAVLPRRLLSYAYIALLLLPPTWLFGALFPLSLHVYTGSVARVRTRLGRAYAVNTIAGIIGSIAAGFVIIPKFGTDALLLGAVVATASLSLLLLRGVREIRRRGVVVAAALGLIVAGALAPGLDYRPLILSVMASPGKSTPGNLEPRFAFLREGLTGVVSVLTYDNYSAALQSNGLTESHLMLHDPQYTSASEALLGLLPYFLLHDPQTAFVVGFGGGHTAYALSQTLLLGDIRVVELEPAIVEAVRSVIGDPLPALVDPRVQLELDDARNVLVAEDARYDLIASQPSHPWRSGAGNLFTREFFGIVGRRLTKGGIFGQWLNLFRMDSPTMLAILRAFFEEFDHGFTMTSPNGGDLLLIGSNEPIHFSRARVLERLAHPELAAVMKRIGVRAPAELLSLFALSRRQIIELTREAEVNTDLNLFSEVRLGRLGGRPAHRDDPRILIDRHAQFDVGAIVSPEDRRQLVAAARASRRARGRLGGPPADPPGPGPASAGVAAAPDDTEPLPQGLERSDAPARPRAAPTNSPLPAVHTRLQSGRWARAAQPADLSVTAPEDARAMTPEQQDLADKLEAIGYMTGSRVSSGSGVTFHDERRAGSGFNFYTSGHGPVAVLTDMSGAVIHRWEKPLSEVWPEFPWLDQAGFSFWRRAHLFDNGDVLAIFEGAAMVKLDRDSNLLWVSRGREHHDMDVREDGSIFVLTRRAQLVPWLDAERPTLVDYVAILDADGRLLREVSVLDMLRASPFADRLDPARRKFGDVLHTNSIFVIDERLRAARPELAAGDVVVSMNTLGTFAVLDLDAERAVWVWSDRRPGGLHDPDPLDGGRLLLFDNGTAATGSRVLELDVAEERELWTFKGSKDRPFFSFSCGTAQRLPNGNTLITESDGGRAFEVTPAGDTVWEFHSPHRAGTDNQFVATLFEVLRLPEDFPVAWARGRVTN